MAELVDAPDSKSGGGDTVGVRFPLPAPSPKYFNRQAIGASSAGSFGGVGASGNHRLSAYYAVDHCAYPVVSVEAPTLQLPDRLAPALSL